jgi:hypothetical protein
MVKIAHHSFITICAASDSGGMEVYMKSKLMKFFCLSLILCILATTVVTNANGSDVPGSYGQNVPVTNQLIINI